MDKAINTKMIELTALDVRQIIKEMQELEGAFVDNIYQYDRQDMLLQIRKGKLTYVRILPHAIWITKQKETAPEKVGGFCSQLRKLLNNARILKIEQICGERIIKISTKEYELFIELFGKGNIIATKEGKTTAAQFSIKFKDREIGIGQTYNPPTKQNILETMGIKFGNEPASKTLATAGLGKTYAEEICHRAGISPNALNADAAKITEQLKQAINETKPAAYENTVSILSLTGRNGKEFPTLSEAIDSILPELIKEKKSVNSEEEKQNQKKQKAIEMQHKQIEKFQQEEQENKRKAETLYENYQKIDLLLKELQKYHKTPHWKEVIENAKPLLKSLDEKNREVTIELK